MVASVVYCVRIQRSGRDVERRAAQGKMMGAENGTRDCERNRFKSLRSQRQKFPFLFFSLVVLSRRSVHNNCCRIFFRASFVFFAEFVKL